MYVTVKQFHESCLAQGVAYTSPELACALEDPSPGAGLPQIISTIGHVLRRPDGHGPFVSRTVDDPAWHSDTAARALRDIINGTVEPVSPTPLPNFNCLGYHPFNKCSRFEPTLARIVMHMAEQNRHPAEARTYAGYGCDIFMHHGVPLFLRKGIFNPLAVSLEEVVVRGVRFPRASIFRIATANEVEYGCIVPDAYHLNVLDTTEIKEIAFGRLSLFAYPPDERPTIPTEQQREELLKHCQEGEFDWVSSALVSDISQIVAEAVVA